MFDPEVLQILGLNLLAGKSPNFGENVGNAGLATLQYQRQREEDKYRKEEREFLRQQREMQIAQMKREQQLRDAIGRGIRPGTPALPYNDTLGDQPPQGMIPGSAATFDPTEAMAIDPLAALQAQAQFAQLNQPKTVKLGKGEAVFGPDGRKLFDNPERQEQWATMSPEDAARMGLPPGIGYQRNSTTGKIDAFGSRAPVTNVTTNVNNPKETFKDSLTLKKDFDGQPEVKGYKEVRQAWDQISTALANPSGANDLAAATKFMKLLDPGSVVRESELAMAMQATGALDRFANYHNQLLNGQKLTPRQREDFFAAGKALHDAAKGRYDQTVNQYQGIAQQYDLDRSFIERGETKLVKNATALVKARQAIAKGAAREQVVQRLVEQGFDPEGL